MPVKILDLNHFASKTLRTVFDLMHFAIKTLIMARRIVFEWVKDKTFRLCVFVANLRFEVAF